MKNFFIVILSFVLFSCNTSSKKTEKQAVIEEPTAKVELKLLWESDTLVRTPESVLIHDDLLFVSNINQGPWEKDGNGFISKMDKSGNIVELKWLEGLSAPKGMGISGSSFFVADIDELVEANLETGEIINRYPVEGEPQLNDVTVGKDGIVYVSGSGSQKIYKLENGSLNPIFEGEEGERFNGLFWEEDRLLLVTSGSSLFKEIPWESMEAKVISENMGHGDAICPVGDGSYITTSWAGAVFHVSADEIVTKLLDTEALEENAADADFCIEEQILYLPTFYKNRVKAYKLVKTE